MESDIASPTVLFTAFIFSVPTVCGNIHVHTHTLLRTRMMINARGNLGRDLQVQELRSFSERHNVSVLEDIYAVI